MTESQLDVFLEFLKASAKSDNAPPRIKGRCMSAFSSAYHSTIYVSHSGSTELHAGLDSRSCTSTAACVAHWLCGTVLDVSQLGSAFGTHLLSDIHEADLISSLSAPSVLLFSTPHHKFCVLVLGGSSAESPDSRVAVLLHSNQDVMHAGPESAFEFKDYLECPKYFTRTTLLAFLGDLKVAAVARSKVDCEDIFKKHFAIPFKKGPVEDYWFSCIPVTWRSS